jgi:hypothetical protein
MNRMQIKIPSLKTAFVVLGLIFQLIAFGQKSEFFKGIDFDSSFCIIGIGQSLDKNADTLLRFNFVIDNPEDMIKLSKDWVFKKPVSNIGIEPVSFDIFIIKDKRTFRPGGIIYPRQGIIKSGNNWYNFDTAALIKLHHDHPLKFRTRKYSFDTFLHYVAFANGILNDSSLLFFQEPSLSFEGEFIIITKRTNDPDSPIWEMGDINKELREFAPENTYTVSNALNDSFNIVNKRATKIEVHCSKSLYDKYKAKTKRSDISEWQPAEIDIKTYWRD